ncbi:MAG: spore cortex biosynthesis protein YabQ [Faecalimonas sp.]|nr:spore cortex biosynthesis protein YabQ [Faecalimonas sp.]
MLGIGQEAAIFLSACLNGILLCLVYTVIRMFRRLIRHSLFWISVEDLFFWIGSGIYLFLEMYRTCDGNIRWYFVLGVLIGAVLSIQLVEKFLKKGIDKFRKKR